MNSLFNLITIYLIKLTLINYCSGHGRLIDPPGRSTAWRFGFRTPINYNDNQLFCGGFMVQHKVNSGKCGICGDPFNGQRTNELPDGRYARPLIITRNYRVGSVIKTSVQLTANHKGYFVFKICPAISSIREVTQSCLDSHPLKVINSPNPLRYYVPDKLSRVFNVTLRLPPTLTCQRCVIQWTYTTGNNWGRCEDGKTSKVGCGPQETFRACADVTIKGQIKNRQRNQTKTTTKPKLKSKIKPYQLNLNSNYTKTLKSQLINSNSFQSNNL